jgi:hypothetical protein
MLIPRLRRGEKWGNLLHVPALMIFYSFNTTTEGRFLL